MTKREQSDILNQRAQDLARPREETQSTQHHLELLVFRLGEERFALETQVIKEVYPLKDLTPLPCTPAFVFGLINLRRRIITVLDIRPLFSIPVEEVAGQKVIILQEPGREFGIVTDGIDGIQLLPVEELQPGLPTLIGIRKDFLLGVTANQLTVLSGSKLMASPHLVVNDTVEAT